MTEFTLGLRLIVRKGVQRSINQRRRAAYYKPASEGIDREVAAVANIPRKKMEDQGAHGQKKAFFGKKQKNRTKEHSRGRIAIGRENLRQETGEA